MNKNDQEFLVQKIKTQYTEKEHIYEIPSGTYLCQRMKVQNRLVQMSKFLICPIKFVNSAKQNSSQKFLGGKRIDSQGVYTTDNGKFVMWEVKPYNLCVLSRNEINIIVSKYTELLSQCPNLEL